MNRTPEQAREALPQRLEVTQALIVDHAAEMYATGEAATLPNTDIATLCGEAAEEIRALRQVSKFRLAAMDDLKKVFCLKCEIARDDDGHCPGCKSWGGNQ